MNKQKQTSLFKNIYEGAVFSPCRTWRYDLWRRWGGKNKEYCTFIMLNPSTANEIDNDPTIRRCIAFAKKWGFSSLHILNIFSFRAQQTHPI